MTQFLHLDINSYFATMLQQKYPSLRNRPVAVLKDIGRTCIIAASKEAKQLGIKTGDSSSTAKQRVPDLIFVPAEFNYYLDCTKTLKRLFESITPQVEIFSLDEAFINLSNCSRFLHPNPFHLSKELQNQIKAQLGSWVTCNIGIGRNRFLAKLVSEVSPKGSIAQITDQNQDYYLAHTQFADICGIGNRLEKKLHHLHIYNLFALNFVSDATLEHYFGPFWSLQLRRMSQGEEPHLFNFIDHLPHAKSIGRSITGYKLATNETFIKATLQNLCVEIIYKLRKMHLAGRQVHLGLFGGDRGSNSRAWHRHLTLSRPICHLDELFHIVYHHLYQSWTTRFPIIKFAVSLNLLEPINRLTGSLLPDRVQQDKLAQAQDQIAKRFGLFALKPALLAGKPLIYPEVTGFLGDKKFHFG